MRTDVGFDAAGTTLRGWLYVPDGATGPCAAVVMAHGLSALKEMGLDDYAEVFVAAGLAVLVYDHRNLGASDGTPRDEIDPVAQMRDYRHAITFAQSQPGIDPERIGIWGTSYTGGLVLMVAALDRRVRAVVSQVPYISAHETTTRAMDADAQRGHRRMLEENRAAMAAGEPSRTVTVCEDDPGKPEDATTRMSFRYFNHYAAARKLAWPNRLTVHSLDLRQEYETMPWMPRISPTPLLMIVASEDRITPTDLALRAYDAAAQPKELLLIPGDHYLPYIENFADSSRAARDFFVKQLQGSRRTRGPDRAGVPARPLRRSGPSM